MAQQEEGRTIAVAKSLARRQLESGAPQEEVIDSLVAKGWTRPEASDFVLMASEIPKKGWVEKALDAIGKAIAVIIIFTVIPAAVGGFLGFFPIALLITIVQEIIGEVPTVNISPVAVLIVIPTIIGDSINALVAQIGVMEIYTGVENRDDHGVPRCHWILEPSRDRLDSR